MSHAIFNAVYGEEPRRRPWVRALVFALIGHAAILVWASAQEPSLQVWAAALSLDLHNALGAEEVVTLETPPPPPPPREKTLVKQAVRPRAPEKAAPAATPSPEPAEAAQVQEGPADLTGTTFVKGSATAYAGGVTATTGASAPGKTPDASEPVFLEATEWSCPWPKDAERADINEQKVVIRVEVAPDGAVHNAVIVRDAPLGFGAAALVCAKKTRFEPALGRDGKPIHAWSPPIQVTFSR